MSKSNALETDVLRLLFNGVAIPNLAENASVAPATTLYLALHTSNPGETGSQDSGEVNYPEYQRVAVARNETGWIVTGSSVSPTNAIEFPEQLTGTASVASHASIGMTASGAGKILYYGALSPTIACNVGVVPRIRPTSTITED